MKPFFRSLFLLALLAGCSSGALMTSDDFAAIQVGTPIQEVTKKYGEPVQIRRERDQMIYQYIERIKMGTETIEMRKYYFVVRDGEIVSKFAQYKDRPAYDEIYSDDMFPDQGG